jgi:DNA polymerase
MRRGRGKWGIIIGEEPGQTEVRSAEAFSGLAGKRLTDWMTESGVVESRQELFDLFYLTSLVKCHVPDKRSFPRAVKNCIPFLERQLEIVNPRVLITLGVQPLRHLFEYTGSLQSIVGSLYREPDINRTLFPRFPPSIQILPLPQTPT